MEEREPAEFQGPAAEEGAQEAPSPQELNTIRIQRDKEKHKNDVEKGKPENTNVHRITNRA
jgi:hypothetical protein